MGHAIQILTFDVSMDKKKIQKNAILGETITLTLKKEVGSWVVVLVLLSALRTV